MKAFYSVTRPRIEGGIVELVKGWTGSSNGGHPNHWHADWQLVAVTRGDGWVRTYGTQHRTPGGSLFLIPPELVHSNDVFDEGCEFRSMLLSDQTVREIVAAAGMRLERARLSRAPVLVSDSHTQWFSSFHDRLECQVEQISVDESLSRIVTELIQRQTAQKISTSAQGIHPAARKARECLWDRAVEDISLAELAVEAGLSRFELSRQFKSAFGMPPHAWQLQARVEQAKPLLKKGSSPGEVAISLGFSDQSHFHRVFRRSTGYTPGQFAGEFRKIVQS